MMFGQITPLLLISLIAPARAITVTDGANESFTIDTESEPGFQVTFNGECDMTSIQYQGVQYQNQEAFSHLASGLGESTQTSYEIDDPYVIVTCIVNNDEFDLTQYYVFNDATSDIYIGTYTNSEPSVGELRFVFRLDNLENAYPFGDVSDTRNGTEIEGGDIYILGNETRSKYYSNERFIDDHVHCAFNDEEVYACFVKPIRAYEASTGGPFARDINLNMGPLYHAVTYYMNHGESTTDPYRMGFHGPYIFTITGNVPSVEDYDFSFFDNLGLTGYIGEADRGYVVGEASGTSEDKPTVVHWYNDKYQQWTYVNSNGSFESPPLSPGEYTQVLYQDELPAGTANVTVTAGATVSQAATVDNPIITEDRTTVFQIGEYDGLPTGFLNADLQNRAHLSDPRMGDWNTPTFVVGESDVGEFPMAIFQDVNDARQIEFTLDENVSDEATIRVATTMAFSGGRAGITVNDYECPDQEGPPDSEGRGITKGLTHGGMSVYTCNIPSGTLASGSNTVIIEAASGSSGDGFLSPNFIVDAIELYY